MQAKRRGNGEGTFYQLADRTWVHQITYGRKPDGSPFRKAFKGRTKAICRERRDAWIAEQEAAKEREKAAQEEAAREQELRAALGHSSDSEVTFGDAFQSWLKLYGNTAQSCAKPKTVILYRHG